MKNISILCHLTIMQHYLTRTRAEGGLDDVSGQKEREKLKRFQSLSAQAEAEDLRFDLITPPQHWVETKPPHFDFWYASGHLCTSSDTPPTVEVSHLPSKETQRLKNKLQPGFLTPFHTLFWCHSGCNKKRTKHTIHIQSALNHPPLPKPA